MIKILIANLWKMVSKLLISVLNTFYAIQKKHLLSLPYSGRHPKKDNPQVIGKVSGMMLIDPQ